MAVFLAIVDAADTAPNDVLLSFVDPCAASVACTTFTAEHPLRQSVHGHIAASAAGGTFLCGTLYCGTTSQLCLSSVVCLAVYDRFMVILHQIHRALPCVSDGLVADAVLPEGLLHQDIAYIFLIGEDAAYCRVSPCRSSTDVGNMLRLQVSANHR